MSTNGIEDEVKTFVCHFFYGLETKQNLRNHTYMLPHHGSKIFKILAPRIYGKTFFCTHTHIYTHNSDEISLLGKPPDVSWFWLYFNFVSVMQLLPQAFYAYSLWRFTASAKVGTQWFHLFIFFYLEKEIIHFEK